MFPSIFVTTLNRDDSCPNCLSGKGRIYCGTVGVCVHDGGVCGPLSALAD